MDEIKIARSLVPKLRKEADIVIALVHMGIYPFSGKGSKRLAEKVPGIDLIVDGHTHTRLDSPIFVKNLVSGRMVPIVQAWKWGMIVGRVDFEIQDKKVVGFRFKAIPINLKTPGDRSDGYGTYRFIGDEIKEDPGLVALLSPYLDRAVSLLSEVIGHARNDFLIKGVRERENALGDLVADSMLWHARHLDVDFAVQNGGGVRADLPEGPITKRMVYDILPFDNSVVVLTLKGRDVQALFDHVAASDRKGAFPQVSQGVRLTIMNKDKRCKDVLIHEEPIDPKRNYKVATNSYLARGGDGYRMFLNAIDRYDSSVFQREVLIQYIKFLGGSIAPRTEGRIILSTNLETQSRLTPAA